MNIIGIRILLLLFLFVSCLPEQAPRDIVTGDPIVGDSTNNVTDSTDETASNVLPEPTNFFQKNGEKTSATLSLFNDYNDSFLIRGNQLMSFLEDVTKTYQSNFCLITNFPSVTGTTNKNVLVLSARIRSYYSSFLRTKEYFLQVEPNNKTLNQNDCLTVSLTNKVNELYGTTSAAYSIDEVCPDCNVNVTSQGLRIFDIFAEERDNAEIDFLTLGIVPAIGSVNNSTQTCSNNSSCTSIGFNCCLEGQCVNHGQVRSEVNTSSNDYLIALQIVTQRPELITNFADVFYVCPLMVPEDTDTSGDDVDPIQQANDLFRELTNIYNCVNPVIDEISVCTKEFDDADSLISDGDTTFSTEDDDITFRSLNGTVSSNNIVEIEYGGVTLFKEQLFETDETVALDAGITLGAGNDSLGASQSALITTDLPSSASNDTLTLYYKVDGTCEKLGSSLARCKKYYNQGVTSTVPRTSDHASGNNTFALPSYADTSFNVIVEVNGTRVSQGSDTWSLSGQNVVFDSTDYPIFDNQEVTITYFVSSNVDTLTASKEAAQTALDAHCACDPQEDPCNLKPISTEINGISTVTSYECVYPDPDVPAAPLQETVYVSAKSVPHKFFDENGVNYDLGDVSSGEQQEGETFEYTDGNNLKPNNVDSYIGFNEIYGTMNLNNASPLPPKVVDVQKGTQYDIFVDQGAFSTCLKCGTDYFSGLQKVFPNNFQYKGGGYLPDFVESRRRTNQGDYPGDDFRFGRACFVPATMIPWTHVPDDDVTTQRRNRLEAQHMLFANGYNKDWYGFDYGALIGSFDGVKWFAIGNQRRIKADSNKLYLAVNAYFGDLTISNTFKVTISEMTAVVNAGSLVNNDLDNDGAQCQRMHICDSDEDCLTQLGYDYVCQNVGGLNTPWPLFDSSGNEMSGSLNTSLLSLVGGSNGEAKRCVYRGVGAICEQRNLNVNSATSYIGSSNVALHSCSLNSQCAAISDDKFNTKIARYAESARNQNAQSFVTEKTDTFGLASRILGRPFQYYGDETIPIATRTQLQTNNVNGLCVPGKDTANSASTEQMNYFSQSDREADKVNNVGRTMASTILQDDNYLSFCPATDDDGDYTHFQDVQLDDDEHRPYAIRNNISSNALILDALSSRDIFNDEDTLVEDIGLHKNTCLRAPGAKCFADFECAPNSFIASRVKSISNFNGEISEAEEKFWEEELVCANSQLRYQTGNIYPNPFYETFEHRCCRETDNEFTYYSQEHIGSEFEVENVAGEPLIPGVNQDYNAPERYSRTHTVYDKLISEPNEYPSLIVSAKQPSIPHTLTDNTVAQYKTLHLHNQRMCCTGHWVRKLASSNTGGHKQTNTALQNIDMSIMRPLSWAPNNDPPLNSFPSEYAGGVPYQCTDLDFQTTDCEVRNISAGSAYEEKYLKWLGKFELLGIPQVLIETNNTVERPLTDSEDDDVDTFEDVDADGVDDNTTPGDLTDLQKDISDLFRPLRNTIKDANDDGVVNASLNGVDYYSAGDMDNFVTGSGAMKQVFSENEFHCCLPTGVEVPANTTDSQCCTGKVADISPTGDNADRVTVCCLEDFTDVTVYTNRYVSSEGAFNGTQAVADSLVDPLTGYIDQSEVVRMASTMCCSGTAATGVALGDYFIPGPPGTIFPGAKTRRFLYDSDLDNASEMQGAASKFEIGLKWNDHIYCVPSNFSADGGGSGSGATAD